jgi:N-acetylglucosamine-6-phosphate deacetylase
MRLEGTDVFSGTAFDIRIERGVITDLKTLSGGGDLPYIAPGFFDIQVNGYRGNDYNASDPDRDQLNNIVSDLEAAGVTRHFPTLITGPHERTLKNVAIVADLVSTSKELQRAIPGIHLEGPYISSEDGPRGAHDPEFVRDPNWEEFLSWQSAARGMIRLITLAPERPGAQEFIRRASSIGVRVALGHTAADAETINAAIRAGASLSTHLGNGSHSPIPRLKNYIWQQLSCDELLASIITDGFHLPDSVIKVFWRAKGKERIILTSDVAVMGGRPPGVYRWGGIEVEVFSDGQLGLAGTEYLAGAAHLLDWDVPRCITATGCSLADAIAACTTNPASFALQEGVTRLEPGASADLVQFRWRPGDQRLQIEQTLRGGRIVYSA